jgi:hypothetical protein
MNDNKPNKPNKKRRKRKQRKQRPAPKPMEKEISELLPESTVKELKRIGAKKRKRRA